jgi:predicted amidohydrolase
VTTAITPDDRRLPREPLRVAAVQAVSRAGDVEHNVASAARWVGMAADAGACLVVLPELFLSGYEPRVLGAHPDACDVTPDDVRLDPLRQAARSIGAAVIVGASLRQPDGRRTVSILAVAADGEATVAYSKQHLWDQERMLFTAGTSGAAVILHDWPLGLGICYDGCFPEHARAASDAGALAYVCPSAYVVGSEHRRDLYYAARALDNGFYVVLSGLSGPCGSLSFSGGTAIYDPQGRPVAKVEAEEGIAVADLDPQAVAEARRINPYDRDRRDTLGGRTRTVLNPKNVTAQR